MKKQGKKNFLIKTTILIGPTLFIATAYAAGQLAIGSISTQQAAANSQTSSQVQQSNQSLSTSLNNSNNAGAGIQSQITPIANTDGSNQIYQQTTPGSPVSTQYTIPENTPCPTTALDGTPSGCDCKVWQQMVNDYNKKSIQVTTTGQNTQIAHAVAAAPPTTRSIGACFSAVTGEINSISQAYNTVASLLSGTPNVNGLMNYAENALTNAACNEVNTVVATSSLTQSINQGVGTTYGTLGQFNSLGATANGIPTGTNLGALTQAGVTKNTGANLPMINQNSIATQLSNYSPFK
jgi:hypothetical protein